MIIGITGGIGTGKSTILDILKSEYDFIIYETDKIAHLLMSKGMPAYINIVNYFGKNILNDNGEINRKKLSDIVFNNKNKLEMLNGFVHGGVIEYLTKEIELSKKEGFTNFVIESALLIESGCYKICDKIWYIYTDPEIRIERLINSRNMTREKIISVMNSQLSKEVFEKYSSFVIDNSFDISNTKMQVQKLLEF